jgi:predicted transcriptional regulator
MATSPLEIKRKKVELLRVSSAKAELELRIHERMEEVERLQEHIKISEAKEVELAQVIADMEKEVK